MKELLRVSNYIGSTQNKNGTLKKSAVLDGFAAAGAAYSDDLNRFLNAPTAPTKPVPRRSMLAGSGTGLLVICPCTVVIPLFDAGGTKFNGLLVMEYVIAPILTDVTVKLTTPVPELEAVNVPLKVAAKELLPAVGTV